jgi:hypothetical protein
MAEKFASNHRELVNSCTISPIGQTALELAGQCGALDDPHAMREEFHTQLIEIIDAYDAADHEVSVAIGGSEIQDDCQTLRELVRALQ